MNSSVSWAVWEERRAERRSETGGENNWGGEDRDCWEIRRNKRLKWRCMTR